MSTIMAMFAACMHSALPPSSTLMWSLIYLDGGNTVNIPGTFYEEDKTSGTEFILVENYSITLTLTKTISESQVSTQAPGSPAWPAWLTPVTDQTTTPTFTGPVIPDGWDESIPFGVAPGYEYFHGVVFRKRWGFRTFVSVNEGTGDVIDENGPQPAIYGFRGREKLWYDNEQIITSYEAGQ